MIHDLQQFHFFRNQPAEFKNKIVRKIPKVEALFTWTHGPVMSWDLAAMFCHEIAHSMVLVKTGKEDRILLQNYGWSRFTPSDWTVRMAENEAHVFAYQWLLMDYFSLKDDGVLGIQNVPMFLKTMCNKQRDEVYFRSYCEHAVKDQRGDFEELLNRMADIVSSAIDKERALM